MTSPDRHSSGSSSSSSSSSSKGDDAKKGGLVSETHARAAWALHRLWEQSGSEAERARMRRDLGSFGDDLSPWLRLCFGAALG